MIFWDEIIFYTYMYLIISWYKFLKQFRQRLSSKMQFTMFNFSMEGPFCTIHKGMIRIKSASYICK